MPNSHTEETMRETISSRAIDNVKHEENTAKGSVVHFLSKNPRKAAEEMMDTIKAIHRIVEEENEALQKANTKVFLALQTTKLDVARLYQQRVQEMLDRQDEMNSLDDSVKNQLNEMQTAFSAMAKTNAELIERMQGCMDRLGGVIRKAAKRVARQQNTYNYDQRGSLDHGERKTVSTGICETA